MGFPCSNVDHVAVVSVSHHLSTHGHVYICCVLMGVAQTARPPADHTAPGHRDARPRKADRLAENWHHLLTYWSDRISGQRHVPPLRHRGMSRQCYMQFMA